MSFLQTPRAIVFHKKYELQMNWFRNGSSVNYSSKWISLFLEAATAAYIGAGLEGSTYVGILGVLFNAF